MIASLGMYDMPELQSANDRYWTAIRSALGHGPETLTRNDDLWAIWQCPDLMLAQTCGYPFRARLHPTVDLVGTPDHGLEGCPAGHYRSVIVARSDDARGSLAEFAGTRFAYNEAMSQSGWAAPVHHMRGIGIRPDAVVETGAHALSARAVAEGRADIAGIDALTWELLCRHQPALTDALRVIDRTQPTPALPYITARGRDARAILDAVANAIAALDPETRDALHLRGVVAIPAEDYFAVPTPPGPGRI